MVIVWTEEAEIRRNESEVGHYSDRRSGILEERVRSRSSFGQEKRESEGTSPKSFTIRTGEANSEGASPKLVIVWTGEAEIRRNESEVGHYSDRRSGILED